MGRYVTLVKQCIVLSAIASTLSIYALDKGPLPSTQPHPTLSQASPKTPATPNKNSRDTLERLLMDHGTLLYENTIALGNNAPQDEIEAGNAKAAYNAGEIANFMADLYGVSARQPLSSLLEEHIQIGSDYLNAVKSNDQTLANQIYNQWLSQAREIANFLSTLIPTLSNQKLSAMWDQHINLEAQLASAYFQGDQKRVDQLKDQSARELREMADFLTSSSIRR